MALVMLPSDLPWWPSLQRHLTQLAVADSTAQLIDGMQKIHNMCNIGLDPEDDTLDLTIFRGLERFLEEDLDATERNQFMHRTLPSMVDRALQLKKFRPPSGLHFTLQQQADRVELDRRFVASLIAHAFFSTFPKRTAKTHPTLQDFNFTNFFKYLNKDCQKAKLRSILHYFDQTEVHGQPEVKIVFSRQVLSSRQWLTIEDWLESRQPLCPLMPRHEGRLESSDPGSVRVCFASAHLGGSVLADGVSQECVQFCSTPEVLAALSFCEALEDNEALTVEGLQQVTRISRAICHPLPEAILVSVLCLDAEDYSRLPVSQFEEDNLLRELNKCLIGFGPSPREPQENSTSRRLSPIGESSSSPTPPERKERPQVSSSPLSLLASGRRGRFIVLGSSGECLPVSRHQQTSASRVGQQGGGSLYSSCNSTDSEGNSSVDYKSARESFSSEGSGGLGADEDCDRRYSPHLSTPERRSTFAERLRDALHRGGTEESSGSNDSSNYAVGIHVAGSELHDKDIKLKRGSSRGFILEQDSGSMSDQFPEEEGVWLQERQWIEKFRARETGGKLLSRGLTSESSKYSFSIDGSEGGDLEETVEEAGGERRRLSELPSLVSRSETDRRTQSLDFGRQPPRLAMLRDGWGQCPGGPGAVSTGNWGAGRRLRGDAQLKLVAQWMAASLVGLPRLYYYTCQHQHLLKVDTICRILLDRRWTVGNLASATLRHAHAQIHNVADEEDYVHLGNLFDELLASEQPPTQQQQQQQQPPQQRL